MAGRVLSSISANRSAAAGGSHAAPPGVGRELPGHAEFDVGLKDRPKERLLIVRCRVGHGPADHRVVSHRAGQCGGQCLEVSRSGELWGDRLGGHTWRVATVPMCRLVRLSACTRLGVQTPPGTRSTRPSEDSCLPVTERDFLASQDYPHGARHGGTPSRAAGTGAEVVRSPLPPGP